MTNNNNLNLGSIAIIEYLKSVFFLSGLALALLVWIIDPFIDAVFLGEGSFTERLLHPDAHEAYMRFFISIVIIIYSFIGSYLLAKSKKLNDALEKSEQSLKLFVDNAPAAIAMFDEEMKYLAYSRRYLTDFELGNQNLIGRSHYDVFPEAPDHWKIIHQRCLAGAIETCDEDSFLRTDGKKEWTRWEIRPWYKSKVKIGGIIFFCEVITEKKEIEIEKKQTFDLLRGVINASQDYIFVKDKNLRTVLCNDIFARALDKKPEDLYGNTDIENGWSEEHVYGDPEKGIRGYEADDKEVLTGKTLRIESEPANINNLTRYFETIKSPLRDEEKNITGILAIARDISERIDSKNALQESEQRYRSLIEATTSIVWTTNAAGEFVEPQTSWENFTGQSWKEHKGTGWTKAIHPNDIDYILSGWKSAIDKKVSHFDSARMWNEKLQEWRDFEVRAVPINNPDGSLREWVGIITDITERKRSEESLQKSEFKYRTLVESSPYCVHQIDNNKNIISMNKAGLDMLNLNNESEIIGLPYLDSVRTEDKRRIGIIIDNVFSGDPQEYEFTSINGLSFKSTFVPIYSQDKKIDKLLGITLDITDQKKYEEQINRYKRLFENSLNEIYLFDSESLKFVQVNSAAQLNLGYSMEELMDMTPLDIKPDYTVELFEDLIRPLRNAEEEMIIFETRHKRKNNSIYDVEVHLQLIEHENGKLLFNAFILDISDRKRANAQLTYQASHDSLTGLINRQEFERRSERLLSTINVNQAEHVLCFMDLDQFKVVNDTCGHIAGDEMLRQLSAVLDTAVRKRDTLARLGGDEFGILMEHCTIEDAHRVASSIQSAIQDYQFVWEESIFKVSVSIGLVSIDETTINFTDLLKNADAACYLSKEAGRNRIHIYDSDDLETVQRQGEMQWVERINRALEEERFCLFAQTIEPLASSQKKHFELLIRMIDETGNTVPPASFLPAAERYNLISRIDQWVIKNAFNVIENNKQIIDNINFFSINLSGQSLTDSNILNLIITMIDKTEIPGEKICLEITETTAISNLSMAIKFISALKEKGCKFALDDFGSGLSSFGYLKKLPVDYLKIDGMFVKDIVDDPIDHAMVRSINEIGHVMGMHTIAEFVENDMIKGMLKEIGVDYVQGYGIGKPEPFEKLLLDK
jgi:diguanylate cyclase (GGDEF)-like protein/PAS domain S-box-containing protein